MLRTLMALCFLCLVNLAGAQELQAIPRLAARVTDQTATLAPDQRSRLETKLADFERLKGTQIAVLIVPTVKPETETQYALRVVESWKLGRQGVDDGVLLLVAKEDRKLRIEVGYGLEGALNDATAKRIISETISPRFKQGDFYGGIDAGLDVMVKVIGGESLPDPKPTNKPVNNAADDDFDIESMLPIGFILIFVVGGILRSIFGRFLAAGIVGGAAGIIASLLFSSVFLAAIAGIVAFVVSLLIGFSGGGGRGWSSGGSSSSWGGSSGGGGFSGGGGSFGGGGASGGW